MKMQFGKYKGLELEEMAKTDPQYIVWLAENCELRGDLFYFVGANYEECKVKKPKRRDYLWSHEDIANMEADRRDEYGWDDPTLDYYDSYPIPNFDY